MKAFYSMKVIKPDNRITTAVCFSLLIHFALVALLVFGLSGNLISSPKLNGINLVWVSLDNKSKNSGNAIQNGHIEQPSPALVRATPQTANIEKPAYKPDATQIFAAATTTTKELTSNITLAKYDLSVKARRNNLKI